MKIFTDLRFIATLRRIAKAMERANELEKFRQEMEYPPLKEGALKPRRAVFSKAVPHTHADWEGWK